MTLKYTSSEWSEEVRRREAKFKELHPNWTESKCRFMAEGGMPKRPSSNDG